MVRSHALAICSIYGGILSALGVADGFLDVGHKLCSLSHMARNRQRSTELRVGDDINALISRLSPDIADEDMDDIHPQVYIVGTGLSDKSIDLPLSTLAILSKASVVLHDNLSLPADEILKVVSESCIVKSVGKRGNDASSVPQLEIDKLLIKYAKEPDKYPTILRLKGGDPFLFGRSRTEIDTLRENQITYKVIPNLSSSVAGPHYAGIPSTDPLLDAQSFAVFSGTNAKGIGIGDDDGGSDWGDVGVDTLIFLMIGRLDKLKQLSQRLIESKGDRWEQDTPCAIVQSAGRAEQRVWRATLATICDKIRKDMGKECTTVSPAIFIVGRVASLDLKGL